MRNFKLFPTFEDKASEYIYYLTTFDILCRFKLLGLLLSKYEKEFYYDNDKIDEWYNDIYNTITDYPDKEKLEIALTHLKKLYNITIIDRRPLINYYRRNKL